MDIDLDQLPAFTPSTLPDAKSNPLLRDVLVVLVNSDGSRTLYISDGISWNTVGGGGGGGGSWGSITGTLTSQSDLNTALNAKQATLVSGTSIKTINSTSLLGSGDIAVVPLYSPVTITGSNSLTHSAKFNRQLLIVDSGNTTQTINNDATNGAQAGDYFEIDNSGSGTVTVAQGTGTLLVGSGFTATIAPNTVGSFVYVGSNTWLSATPAASSGAGSTILSGGSFATVTHGTGNNQAAAVLVVPANALSATGTMVVRMVLARTGTTDSLTTSARIGASGGTFISANSAYVANITATQVRYGIELLISGNRVDQSTVLVECTGGSWVGPQVSGNSLTITRDTSSAWQVQVGGNAGTTDDYSCIAMMAEIFPTT